MDRRRFGHLMAGAVRGVTLVFVAYALRFDRFAFRQVVRTGYHVLRDRAAIGSVPVGLRYYAEGLALGPLYRLKRPPRLVDRPRIADRLRTDRSLLRRRYREPV
jgi:hypothetical protein